MALVSHRNSGHNLFARCYYFERTNILSKTLQIHSKLQTQHGPLNCKLTQRNNSFGKDINLIQQNKFNKATSARQSQHDDNHFRPLYRVLRLRDTLGACAVVLEQSQHENNLRPPHQPSFFIHTLGRQQGRDRKLLKYSQKSSQASTILTCIRSKPRPFCSSTFPSSCLRQFSQRKTATS